MTSEDRPDVVALLRGQHERIREMFGAVEAAHASEKQDRFEELRRFLAVHETAEEMVVHPAVREAAGGDDVADARLAEEHSAKQLLEGLDGMSVDAPDFDTRLDTLRSAVLTHAEGEEREEFPLLRRHHDEKKLVTMAEAVRAAESMAPTHPHAGIESLTANLMVGPIAAVVDRTRDAVRAVLDREPSRGKQ